MPTWAAVSGQSGCRRILVCAGVGVVLVGGGTVPMRAYVGPPGVLLAECPGGPCSAWRRCAHGRGGCCRGRGSAGRGPVGVSGLWWCAGSVGVGSGAGAAGWFGGGERAAAAVAVSFVWWVACSAAGVRAVAAGGCGDGDRCGVGGEGGWCGCSDGGRRGGAAGGNGTGLAAPVRWAGRVGAGRVHRAAGERGGGSRSCGGDELGVRGRGRRGRRSLGRGGLAVAGRRRGTWVVAGSGGVGRAVAGTGLALIILQHELPLPAGILA
jgi:hypothetical protein